jgi:hypothetical protein
MLAWMKSTIPNPLKPHRYGDIEKHVGRFLRDCEQARTVANEMLRPITN